MQKIDLIALDLDGTALTPDNTVSEATREAVRRARGAGLYVVVSTGRICGEARDFAIALGADDLMVTSGGASISSVSRGQCTMRMSMPWEPAVRAAAVVERIGVTAMIYVGETLLITPTCPALPRSGTAKTTSRCCAQWRSLSQWATPRMPSKQSAGGKQ